MVPAFARGLAQMIRYTVDLWLRGFRKEVFQHRLDGWNLDGDGERIHKIPIPVVIFIELLLRRAEPCG